MNPYQPIFDRLANRAIALARTSADERIVKVRALYRAVYDLREEISAAGYSELGMDGRLHLVPLKGEVDYVCQQLSAWMEREPVEDTPALMGRKGSIHYEPKGVVLHLAAWNSPILIALAPLVSMMAAGDTVVLKPSEITPANAALVRRIIAQAGLEDDIAVIEGGAEAAQALLELPFNHICYVGNNRVGRLVMEAAAKHFAGVTLEMGGKNPAIVEADADIGDAAAKLAFSRTVIAGQVCLSPDYALVHESRYDEFITALIAALTAMFDPEGKGAQASGDFARIVNSQHLTRIKGLLDDALAKGARIECGGTFDEASRFFAPTILSGITDDMQIADEEIFGPILLVKSFSAREEATAEIARRPKPLGIYIFTADPATAQWYLDHTRAGTSAINNAVVQANVATLPFGGCNHSGIGRLGGHAGFKEFSNARSVVEDGYSRETMSQMYYPPFPAEAAAFVEMMLMPTA
jgi:aldehyde dehydrogenase (NAD+)